MSADTQTLVYDSVTTKSEAQFTPLFKRHKYSKGPVSVRIGNRITILDVFFHSDVVFLTACFNNVTRRHTYLPTVKIHSILRERERKQQREREKKEK